MVLVGPSIHSARVAVGVVVSWAGVKGVSAAVSALS